MRLMQHARFILAALAVALAAPIAHAQAFTDYLENKVADHLFRGTAYAPAGPYYVALYLNSSNCTDAGGGTEVSGGSYARVAITKADGTWTGTHGTTTGVSSGTGGQIGNAAPITFPAATADWGTVGSWAIMDASTAGNMLICATLTATRSITNGATASFSAGALTVTLQ